MASMEVVVVDADVLIPILACDFLLTGLDLAIYELAVSPIVLDEVERHLLTDFPVQWAELDAGPDGKRRQASRGGFRTRREAEAA